MFDDGRRPTEALDGGSFLDEFRQRRVPRVALVYLTAGFAIVVAADIQLPRPGLVGRSDDAFDTLGAVEDLLSGDFATPYVLESDRPLRPLRADSRWASRMERLADPLPRPAG